MRVIFIFIFILSIFLFAEDEEFVVVTSNKSKVKSVSKKLLKDLYLKEKSFVDEQEIVPINLPPQNELRIHFEEEILGMDREEINDFWITKHYQGVTPPIVQKSQDGLKLFIQNVDGAIGYLEKKNLNEELKIIHEF